MAADGRGGGAGEGGAAAPGPVAAGAGPSAGPVPAAPPAVDPVAALEARLGLRLADRARALAAITHKSWVNEHRDEPGEDNERLEFLGDAVVDLLVSHRLMERFPGAREGELSKMRASVVDEPGLARIARELRIGELLRLGRGEELTGGREKASLLADALEAVFAAIFLEHGLGPAQSFLDRFLHDTYERASAGTLDRDFKTQMQEVCQSRFRVSPRYRVTADHGPDHLKTFDVEVTVNGEVLGRGSGRSKKDAEQVAARQALGVLAARPHWPFEPSPEPSAAPGPGAGPEAGAGAAPAAGGAPEGAGPAASGESPAGEARSAGAAAGGPAPGRGAPAGAATAPARGGVARRARVEEQPAAPRPAGVKKRAARPEPRRPRARPAGAGGGAPAGGGPTPRKRAGGPPRKAAGRAPAARRAPAKGPGRPGPRPPGGGRGTRGGRR